jgi:subtilisin family serine protease
MKKIYFVFLMLLSFSNFYGQELDSYYFEVKEGYELGDIQKITKTDGTLTLSFSNTALANALNSKPIYSFEKAFPKSGNRRLQRIYELKTTQNTSFTTLLNRIEVFQISLIDENDFQLINSSSNAEFDVLPNDYEDIMFGGRNQALDLIRGPQAWRISTGNNVIIGVSDSKIDANHEDLQGQILQVISLGVFDHPHGTSVTGRIIAKTNNDKGIASIAHGGKAVFVGGDLINGIIELIDLKKTVYPNLKIINCSWVFGSANPGSPLYEVIHGEDGTNANGILVV